MFDVEDHTRSLLEGEREHLSGYLAVALLEHGQVRLVPRSSIRAKLRDRKGRSYRNCCDETCQIELGKALAAQRAVQVAIFPGGEGCELGLTVYDLASETAMWGASVGSACGLSALLEGADALAQRFASGGVAQ